MTVKKNMLGVWLENQAVQFRDNLPTPIPSNDEALVRVLLAGICGTDIELLKGYYSFTGIPGHEFVGEVIEAPSAPQLIGKRVVGEINIGCGHCQLCKSGLNKHCINRSVLGIKHHQGVFSEYLSLPIKNLHIVPDNVSLDKAVFTEPIAAAARILEQIDIKPNTTVLIIGAGRLGLLIAQVVNSVQCSLQVVARHDKQRLLLDQFAVPSIKEHEVPTHKFDIVIEATGSAAGLHTAIQAVKPTGSVVLKSTYAGETNFDFSRLVVNEITIIGSRCGSFEPALALLQQNLVDPTLLISARYTLKQVNEAFAAAMQPGALKVLFQPE